MKLLISTSGKVQYRCEFSQNFKYILKLASIETSDITEGNKCTAGEMDYPIQLVPLLMSVLTFSCVSIKNYIECLTTVY